MHCQFRLGLSTLCFVICAIIAYGISFFGVFSYTDNYEYFNVMEQVALWFVCIGSVLVPFLLMLANIKLSIFFFIYFATQFLLLILQTFFVMARFVGDPTDQDSLNVAMLSFQFLSAICAVYASIVACVGFACAKRDDVGEKERRLPRVMIAWIVFACFGMVLLIAANIVRLLDIYDNVDIDAVGVMQWMISITGPLIFVFPFIAPVHLLRHGQTKTQVAYIFYSGFGAMCGWPIAFIAQLIEMVWYNDNVSFPAWRIVRFVSTIFFAIAAIGFEVSMRIVLRRARHHHHHHHSGRRANEGYAVLEHSPLNPNQAAPVPQNVQTPGYYDPNTFQKAPPAYDQSYQQQFSK